MSPISIYFPLFLSFSLCDSNEKACPGNSLSRKYTEAGERGIHAGGMEEGISSHLGGKMKARGKRAVSGLQKIKSSDSGA